MANEMAGAQALHNRRFFASTRGRLVGLLRRAGRTVEELAQSLDLTDNAVRAHLTSLERDGLVQQQGVRRSGGSGKPAFTYCLTEQAEALFPKAYGELLRQLLGVLSRRLGPDELEAVLGELASQLADGRRAKGSPEARVAAATAYLNELGGLAEWQRTDAGWSISGCSCPLAAILPGNPNACHLAELLLTEVTGLPACEHCQSDPPRCEFDLATPTN